MSAQSRVLTFIFLGVVLVTPMLDQLACAFCGPTSATSMTAEEVSHVEDDCILSDGFERRPDPSDTNQQPTHIHFCILHSTSVALSEDGVFIVEAEGDSISPIIPLFEDLHASCVFHPPKVS